MKTQKGFTVVELMVTVTILGILIMVAIPNFNDWVVKMRVDNEVSSLQRLILTTRNTSVNMELNVTLCPLDTSNKCVNDWTKELVVFTDIDNDGNYEPSNDEVIIRTKSAITNSDSLVYDHRRLIYGPTGTATNFGDFVYCPYQHADKNRGIEVSMFGRAYVTNDHDNDGKDEERGSTSDLSC